MSKTITKRKKKKHKSLTDFKHPLKSIQKYGLSGTIQLKDQKKFWGVIYLHFKIYIRKVIKKALLSLAIVLQTVLEKKLHRKQNWNLSPFPQFGGRPF